MRPTSFSTASYKVRGKFLQWFGWRVCAPALKILSLAVPAFQKENKPMLAYSRKKAGVS